MSRRLNKEQAERALVVGVARVSPTLSVDQIIGLSIHLKDGRELFADSDRNGNFRLYWPDDEARDKEQS